MKQKKPGIQPSPVTGPSIPQSLATNALADSQLPAIKAESLRWVFAILGAILLYTVLAELGSHLYQPDINALRDAARNVLIEPDMSAPKPVESLLFRLAIITIVPATIAIYFALSRAAWIKKAASSQLYLILSSLVIMGITALLYFDFAADNNFAADIAKKTYTYRDTLGTSNFEFYFKDFFTGKFLWVYLLVIVPSLAGLFLVGFRKKFDEYNKVYKIIAAAIQYSLLFLSIVAIVGMNTFHFPYTNQNKIDFNAVYFSMTQVYSGLPMLADHFTNTYGLYPQFLNPLFCIIGLNIFKFSLVMSLLTGFCFLFNFLFLKRHISNKLILLLGFSAILYFPYLFFKLVPTFDSIFSYYPIRYIIPSTLVLLASYYVAKPSARLYYLTGVVMAFFILWNPEFGLVCYISWFIMNLYLDFYTADGKPNQKKWLFHIVACAGILVLVFALYELIIYIFYGSFPNLSLLFSTIFVFGKLGFGLLPMSLLHPWHFMALIIIIGFLYAGIPMLHKNITPKSAIVLLVSLISLGYFVYFEGRSHNFNFSISSGFCIMLLALLGDELWQTIKTHNAILLNALFVVFLAFISFSFFEIMYNVGGINDLVYQEADQETQAKEQGELEHDKDFFLSHSKAGEKLFLFTSRRFEGLLYDGEKRRSAFLPGMEDLFLKTDLTRIENRIRDSSYNIIIEPAHSNYLFLERPFANIAASYEYSANYNNMYLLQKRTTKIPAQTFFSDSGIVLLHRKYTDDTTGENQRVSDAFGVQNLTLNPEFSVQILFYSTPQIYNSACLVSNTLDSIGFAIAELRKTDHYYFAVSGRGCDVVAPYNEWSYFVLNVYADHLDIYRNGIGMVRCSIQHPIRKSENKVSVGNLGVAHYYVGAIAEVAVSNNIIDSFQVRKTWRDIKETVKK